MQRLVITGTRSADGGDLVCVVAAADDTQRDAAGDAADEAADDAADDAGDAAGEGAA